MSTTKSFGGVSYDLPDNREPKGWGADLALFLQAIADKALTTNGGSYALTSADLDFGDTYGLIAPYFKSGSSNIAASGIVRLANNESLTWRNAANSADLSLKVDTGNVLEFNGNDLATAANNLSFFSATTSAQLAALISDETGSGALVFANTPTLVTPVLGVATATSINKVAFTAPATGSTLTIADGKTLTASNTLTMTATDGSTAAFGVGGTVAYKGLSLAQFASTTSAELAALISDETGSGSLVFAGSPTFTGTVTLPILVGTDTTDASSSTTGAFKTAGGLGVAKTLYVGQALIAGNTTAVQSKIITGNSGATATFVNGEIHFGNSDASAAIPTITGATTTANKNGLYISAGANDTNTNGDMVFDVRESDTSAGTDFATTTSKGFVWSRYGTELASLTRAGNMTLTLGNVVMGTSGKGIDFSATSNTSASGASMSSELFADYEEGTWTPVFTGSTGSAGAVAYTSQSGSYTKFGRLVHAYGRLQMSNLGSWTGKIFITGLPFTQAASVYNSVVVSYFVNTTTSMTWIGGYINGSSNQIVFSHRASAGTSSTDSSVTDWANNTEVVFTAVYYV